MPIRLGINIDHVATIRNARGGVHPCPIRAALLALEAGANGITAHLREDRRHIKDHDVKRLQTEVPLPLNLEMAATDEMLAIALKNKPHAVCLVPENRAELTTEGGLDVVAMEKTLTPYVKRIQDNGSHVSLFIDPNIEQIEAASRIGACIIELHTGSYAENKLPLNILQKLSTHAHSLGLEIHAGHGLNYKNVAPVAAIPEIVELNIGHFIIGEAVFVGLKEVITQMHKIIDNAH